MSRCQRECHRFEPDILLQILLIYTMYDIIFCTLPVMSIDQIYSAPALLKGIVKSAGFRSRTFDFVIDLNKFCNKNSEQFSRIQNYFVTQNLFLNQDDQDILNKWYNHVATTLQSIDTKYIGFSVFSNWTHRATLEILLKLKELDLSHKVVLGGRGLKTNTNDTVVDLLPNKSINDRIHWFGTVLKNKGLAQHIIIGDGENAVVDFLQTNTTRNDNVAKGFDFPWPDYSDYNFDDYNWNGSPHLQVIGSKGCVRNCDFCDVKVQFGNYQFKDGYQLANEMITLQQQYQIDKFVLQDSLSNGSMKHFKQFLTRLSEHNASSANKIKWSGTYICRDMRNTANVNEYYQQLSCSGAEGLTIGAESGSNHVLKSINKKSSVEALFFELEKFKENNITCQLLTFTGHWSETHADFEKHCNMILNLVPYIKHGTVSSITLGDIFVMLHNTPSWNNDELIKDPYLFSNLWVAKNNTNNTLKVRVQRRLVLHKMSKLLKLPVADDEFTLQSILGFVENHTDKINDFFQRNGSTGAQIPDIDLFIQKTFKKYKTINLELEVESFSCNSDPVATVSINQTTLVKKFLSGGIHKFNFKIPAKKIKNTISVTMTNKAPHDTVVDTAGNIIKDKSIKIKSLKINGCDLIVDVDFFYKNFVSSINGEIVDTRNGLWFENETLSLCFETPFVLWYASNSNKNVSPDWLERKNSSQISIANVHDIYQNLLNVTQKLII